MHEITTPSERQAPARQAPGQGGRRGARELRRGSSGSYRRENGSERPTAANRLSVKRSDLSAGAGESLAPLIDNRAKHEAECRGERALTWAFKFPFPGSSAAVRVGTVDLRRLPSHNGSSEVICRWVLGEPARHRWVTQRSPRAPARDEIPLGRDTAEAGCQCTADVAA